MTMYARQIVVLPYIGYKIAPRLIRNPSEPDLHDKK